MLPWLWTALSWLRCLFHSWCNESHIFGASSRTWQCLNPRAACCSHPNPFSKFNQFWLMTWHRYGATGRSIVSYQDVIQETGRSLVFLVLVQMNISRLTMERNVGFFVGVAMGCLLYSGAFLWDSESLHKPSVSYLILEVRFFHDYQTLQLTCSSQKNANVCRKRMFPYLVVEIGVKISQWLIPEFPESPKSRPQHRTLDRFFTCLHSLTWWFSSLSYTV